MIGWISLQIIFSLLIIVLAHSVYKFLKNNLNYSQNTGYDKYTNKSI